MRYDVEFSAAKFSGMANKRRTSISAGNRYASGGELARQPALATTHIEHVRGMMTEYGV